MTVEGTEFEYRGNIKSHYNLFPVDRKIWFSMLFCRTLQLHRMTTREWTKTKYKCARCIFRWRSTTGYRIFVLRPSERGLVSRPRIFAGKKPAFLRKLKARGYFRWRMWRCSLRKWPFLSKPQFGPAVGHLMTGTLSLVRVFRGMTQFKDVWNVSFKMHDVTLTTLFS